MGGGVTDDRSDARYCKIDAAIFLFRLSPLQLPMTSPEPTISDRVFMKRTVEAAIRIAVIAGLIVWCFIIARPFLVPIIWGAIIALAVFHGYEWLQTSLGGRRITAAVLITLLMSVLLVVPSVLLGESLVSGAHKVVDSFQGGELHIPPPPASVARWPLIGKPIAKAWTLASEDLEEAAAPGESFTEGLRQLAPQCRWRSRTCAFAVRVGDLHLRCFSRQF